MLGKRTSECRELQKVLTGTSFKRQNFKSTSTKRGSAMDHLMWVMWEPRRPPEKKKKLPLCHSCHKMVTTIGDRTKWSGSSFAGSTHVESVRIPLPFLPSTTVSRIKRLNGGAFVRLACTLVNCTSQTSEWNQIIWINGKSRAMLSAFTICGVNLWISRTRLPCYLLHLRSNFSVA